jgi:hypothetical protein
MLVPLIYDNPLIDDDDCPKLIVVEPIVIPLEAKLATGIPVGKMLTLKVPVLILLALRSVNPEPLPLILVDVIAPALKLPLLSLDTIVLGVLEDVALLLIVYVAFSPLPLTPKPTPVTATTAT